jgi:hypothetical protein
MPTSNGQQQRPNLASKASLLGRLLSNLRQLTAPPTGSQAVTLFRMTNHYASPCFHHEAAFECFIHLYRLAIFISHCTAHGSLALTDPLLCRSWLSYLPSRNDIRPLPHLSPPPHPQL